MNRMQRLQAILWLERLAEEANRQASQFRSEIRAEAVEEFEANGGAPRWEYRDLATVSLVVTKSAAAVTDPKVFQSWVADRHPEEIVHTASVRSSWQEAFLSNAIVEGDRLVDPVTGELIPGVGVKPGGEPRHITIKATGAAKEVFGHLAGVGLKELAASKGPGVPVVLAELEASDAGS